MSELKVLGYGDLDDDGEIVTTYGTWNDPFRLPHAIPLVDGKAAAAREAELLAEIKTLQGQLDVVESVARLRRQRDMLKRLNLEYLDKMHAAQAHARRWKGLAKRLYASVSNFLERRGELEARMERLEDWACDDRTSLVLLVKSAKELIRNSASLDRYGSRRHAAWRETRDAWMKGAEEVTNGSP